MNSLEFDRIIDEIIRQRTEWEQRYDRAMKELNYDIAERWGDRIGAANQIIANLRALREAGL